MKVYPVKKIPIGQSGFAFDEEGPIRASIVPVEPRPPTGLASGPSVYSTYRSDRETVREQIIRDSKVLEEDPVYWEPSREFFEERIASFKEWLKELDDDIPF